MPLLYDMTMTNVSVSVSTTSNNHPPINRWLIEAIYIRVIEFLRNFEFRNWHAMIGRLMLTDSISEEKLEID